MLFSPGWSAGRPLAGGEEKAHLQLVHASSEPELAQAAVYLTVNWPHTPLGRPRTTVAFGKATGYIDVPAGAYSLVVCPARGPGGCASGGYELEPGAYRTMVLIGGRVNVGGDPAEGLFNIRIENASAPTAVARDIEARWRSRTGRRASLLNALLESPVLEACVVAGGKRRPLFTGRGPEDREGTLGLYGSERRISFGEWGGVGPVDDEGFGASRGMYADIPAGAVTFELRAFSEEKPCTGQLWGQSRLVSPIAGAMLMVAVGHAGDLRRTPEMIACTEPRPPRASRCFRYPIRRGGEPSRPR